MRIKYVPITMAKETEREEIKEETHELEDEEKDELVLVVCLWFSWLLSVLYI